MNPLWTNNVKKVYYRHVQSHFLIYYQWKETFNFGEFDENIKNIK